MKLFSNSKRRKTSNKPSSKSSTNDKVSLATKITWNSTKAIEKLRDISTGIDLPSVDNKEVVLFRDAFYPFSEYHSKMIEWYRNEYGYDSTIICIPSRHSEILKTHRRIIPFFSDKDRFGTVAYKCSMMENCSALDDEIRLNKSKYPDQLSSLIYMLETLKSTFLKSLLMSICDFAELCKLIIKYDKLNFKYGKDSLDKIHKIYVVYSETVEVENICNIDIPIFLKEKVHLIKVPVSQLFRRVEDHSYTGLYSNWMFEDRYYDLDTTTLNLNQRYIKDTCCRSVDYRIRITDLVYSLKSAIVEYFGDKTAVIPIDIDNEYTFKNDLIALALFVDALGLKKIKTIIFTESCGSIDCFGDVKIYDHKAANHARYELAKSTCEYFGINYMPVIIGKDTSGLSKVKLLSNKYSESRDNSELKEDLDSRMKDSFIKEYRYAKKMSILRALLNSDTDIVLVNSMDMTNVLLRYDCMNSGFRSSKENYDCCENMDRLIIPECTYMPFKNLFIEEVYDIACYYMMVFSFPDLDIIKALYIGYNLDDYVYHKSNASVVKYSSREICRKISTLLRRVAADDQIEEREDLIFLNDIELRMENYWERFIDIPSAYDDSLSIKDIPRLKSMINELIHNNIHKLN